MQRKISWSKAIADAKADRTVRSEVRCERLKTGSSYGHYVAWRGKSGRRYVFSAAPISNPGLAGIEAGDVVLRVRLEDGAYVIRAANIGRIPAAGDDTDCIHVHTLAEGRDEALALINDLRGSRG